MPENILQFLRNHRVCSLSIALPDGSPHAAAMHYSHSDAPLQLFFSTEKRSKKCQGLLSGEKAKASVAIGQSEEEWITLQMDGTVRAITTEEGLSPIKKLHYAKHPDSQQYEHDPQTIFLEFTPQWWRYSDYNTKPMTAIESSL